MIGSYVEYHTDRGKVMATDGDRWLWVKIKGELVRARRAHCKQLPSPAEYKRRKRECREKHFREKAKL